MSDVTPSVQLRELQTQVSSLKEQNRRLQERAEELGRERDTRGTLRPGFIVVSEASFQSLDRKLAEQGRLLDSFQRDALGSHETIERLREIIVRLTCEADELRAQMAKKPAKRRRGKR